MADQVKVDLRRRAYLSRHFRCMDFMGYRMSNFLCVEYGKLVTFTETAELTKKDWDRVLEYASKRFPQIFVGIQTEVRENHWLTNYMEFCNEQTANDE
jgi:hypothetical protein